MSPRHDPACATLHEAPCSQPDCGEIHERPCNCGLADLKAALAERARQLDDANAFIFKAGGEAHDLVVALAAARAALREIGHHLTVERDKHGRMWASDLLDTHAAALQAAREAG